MPSDKKKQSPFYLHCINRRDFLKTAGLVLGGAMISSGSLIPDFVEKSYAEPLKDILHRAPVAKYWTSANAPGVNCLICHSAGDIISGESYRHENGYVKCRLCAQECLIEENAAGFCRARFNDGGVLKSLVYGRPVTVHVDPIEKKPFYHFLPGSQAFSLATAGCPLSCKFCQNWQISQAKPGDFQTNYISPEEIVAAAKNRQAPVIAYTYNEPTVFAEYLMDISRLGKNEGLRNVIVSCGLMNAEPLDDMCRVLDGIKIDLKGFSRDFYRNVCNAELEPVLNSIRQVAKNDVHLEIVNLVVPTLNDSEKMLRDLVKWIVAEAGPDVPVHFTRFHPDYKMLNLPPTPISTLERAYDIAKAEGLHYPYVGNVPGHPGNHTVCPKCRKNVIERTGFFVTRYSLNDGRCEFCGEAISGVWA